MAVKAQMGRTPMEPIKTERLVLRPFAAADAAALVRLLDDIEVSQWLARVPHPYTRSDAEKFLAHLGAGGETAWAIVRDGALVGGVGLTAKAPVTLGYWIGRAHWGHGYVCEAARAAIVHGFRAMGLTEIASGCFEDNVRSARVLEKLGFEWTAIGEKRSLAQGRDLTHRDAILTRDAWDACA